MLGDVLRYWQLNQDAVYRRVIIEVRDLLKKLCLSDGIREMNKIADDIGLNGVRFIR